MVRAMWNGVVIAESDDTVVVGGNHYFPLVSVRAECLAPSERHTVCSWKGTASYYDVVAAGEVNVAAAWFYPDPSDAAASIAGRIAFWCGVTIAG